jgi:hypothetical protein
MTSGRVMTMNSLDGAEVVSLLVNVAAWWVSLVCLLMVTRRN